MAPTALRMATSIPRPSRRATATFHGGVSPVMKVPLDTRVVISRRRAGTVRYIGRIANETGEWYGIALDEAKGDSDGSIDKERYFQCAPNHGVFVRRKEVSLCLTSIHFVVSQLTICCCRSFKCETLAVHSRVHRRQERRT